MFYESTFKKKKNYYLNMDLKTFPIKFLFSNDLKPFKKSFKQ